MRQVILNLHGIGAPERPLEPGEAPYWITWEMFSGVIDLVARLRDRVAVSFTFDDGNLSDLPAARALAAAGHKALIFPLADRMDMPGSLRVEDLGELQKMGHRIGSHGGAHIDWTALDAAGVVAELDTARDRLARLAGSPVTAAAIPFGRYDRKVLQALKARGYGPVYSSDGGAWRAGQYPVPRNSLTAGMTLADIEAILTGPESLKRRLRRGLARTVKQVL